MRVAREHVELNDVEPGMPVILEGRVVGHVEEVVPQPDGLHIFRLITRLVSPPGRQVPIPIEWVGRVEADGVVLVVGERELRELPEYVPAIPVEVLRMRLQQALDEHPSTAGKQIAVTTHGDALTLRGRVADARTRTAAGAVADSVAGLQQVHNLIEVATHSSGESRD